MTMPQASSGPDDEKRLVLHRMRRLATLVLIGMAALFVLGAALAHMNPVMGFVEAFGEAGLVGGLADWFAVVALFRQPLGLPIPHTAILVRNQPRLSAAIGNFIANHFLTADALTTKVADIDILGAASRWLQLEDNRRLLADELSRRVPEFMAATPQISVGDRLGDAILRQLEAMPLAPLAAQLLAALWDRGLSAALMDEGLAKAHTYVVRERKTLVDRLPVSERTWRPKWLNRFLTQRVVDALASLLGEMKQAGHPWRNEARDAYERAVRALAGDPEVAAKAEAIKLGLLSDPAVRARLTAPLRAWERNLTSQDAEDREQLRATIEKALGDLQVWLAEPREDLAGLNAQARDLIVTIVAPNRRQLGAFFSDIVARWDANALSDRLELAVGADLQYIRINGALVGGLVGIGLHAISLLFRL